MGKSSAASAANAACDHVHDLWYGTTEEKGYASMGVISDGNTYGVPEGIMYSFPCMIAPGGKWAVVDGLKINDFSREKMDKTAKELLEERKMALGF